MLGLQQTQFLAVIVPSAVATERKTGLPAEVTIAQAILETGWGRNAPGNNYFGIKANGRGAGTQMLTTREFVNGKYVVQSLAFEKYDSPEQCFDDHATLLTSGVPYRVAWAQYQADHDLIVFVKAIAKVYATAPNYGDTLLSIIASQYIRTAVAQARETAGLAPHAIAS